MREDTITGTVFETMMKEAVAANFQAKMDAMPSQGESEHRFSDGHNRKMKKLFAMERRMPFVRGVRAFAKAAAIVLCVAAALFAGILTFNPEVRAAVREAVVQFFEDHLQIEFREPEGEAVRAKQDFAPRHIPEGYALTHEETHVDMVMAIYENPDGDMLIFSVAPPGLRYVSSEYLIYYTETHDGITYHINESHYHHEGVYSVIIWLQGDFVFSLNGLLPIDELMAVVRSVG